MPELPEVETVRTGLETALKGATISRVTLRRRDLRVPFPKNLDRTLSGRTFKKITRRAKYILFYFDSDDVLIAHLGMTGRFSINAQAPKAFAAHDHVIIRLADGRCMIFNDARRFGLMLLSDKKHIAAHPLLAKLGPEPFDKSFSPAYLAAELKKRSSPIKVALMDQELVVGVGNIYASEVLFLAAIDPRCKAKNAAKQAHVLVSAICEVLGSALASGGSSLKDFVHVSGDSGYFQHQFKTYDRKGEPCFKCHFPIQSLRQAGRSTFYCKHCQRA